MRARRWRQGAPQLLGAFYTEPPTRIVMPPRSPPSARQRGLEDREAWGQRWILDQVPVVFHAAI